MKKKKIVLSLVGCLIVVFLGVYQYNHSNKVLLEKAIHDINQYKYDDALELLDKIETKEVSSKDSILKDVYRNKSIVYYKMGNYEEAIAYCEKVLASNSEDEVKKIIVGLQMSSYHFLEMFDKSIDVGEEYVKKYSDDTPFAINVYDDMFDAYIGLKEYDKAREINNTLKEIDPQNVQHYIGTVYLYFYMEKEEEAVAYLQEIADKFPRNSEIEKLYKRYVK